MGDPHAAGMAGAMLQQLAGRDGKLRFVPIESTVAHFSQAVSIAVQAECGSHGPFRTINVEAALASAHGFDLGRSLLGLWQHETGLLNQTDE